METRSIEEWRLLLAQQTLYYITASVALLTMLSFSLLLYFRVRSSAYASTELLPVDTQPVAQWLVDVLHPFTTLLF